MFTPKTFEEMLSYINSTNEKIEVVLPVADSSSALKGVAAFIDGVKVPVKVFLSGNEKDILTIIEKNGLSDILSGERIELFPAAGQEDAFRKAFECLNPEKNQIILKGNTSTDVLMKAVLRHKEKIIEKGSIITHMRVIGTKKGLCILTDGGINVVSNITTPQKRASITENIRKNAEKVMHIFGHKDPFIYDTEKTAGFQDLEREFTSRYIEKGTFPQILRFPWIGPANIIYKAIVYKPWNLEYKKDLPFEKAGIVSHFIRTDGGRPLFLASPYRDAGVEEKKELLEYALDRARADNIERPGAALLDFTEQYAAFPDTPSILDSRKIVEEFAERGDSLVDGPMAYDLAVSQAAVKTKGYDSLVAGNPDILFSPDYIAGALLKSLYKNWKALRLPWPAADISFGGSFPILIPSRSDSPDHKLRSVITAAFLSLYKSG